MIRPGRDRGCAGAAFACAAALAAAWWLEALGLPRLLPESVLAARSLRWDGASLALFTATWTAHAAHAAAVIVLLAAAAGAGAAARALVAPPARDLAAAAGRLGLGLGLLAAGLLGAGLAGLFAPAPLLVLAAPGLVAAIRRRNAAAATARRLLALLRPASRGDGWLLAPLALLAAASLATALGPEGGWDALYYHLRLPKEYVLLHRIAFVPAVYMAHFPQGIELLYGAGWLLGGEGAAKLVNWALWPLGALAVAGLAESLGGRAALRAVALVLALPVAGAVAAQCYVENGMQLFLTAAVAEAAAGRAAAAGLLLGALMGTKYLGVLAALGAGAAWLAGGRSRRGALRMAAASAVPVLPWLAKNALFTGDPFAPYLYASLGTLPWAGGFDQVALADRYGAPTVVRHAGDVLTALPGFLRERQFGILSPALVAGMALLAGPVGRGAAGFATRTALGATGLLLLCAPVGRYWHPVAGVLAVALAARWGALDGVRSPAAVAWRLLVALSLGVGPAWEALTLHRELTETASVGLGLVSRADYMERRRFPEGYARATDWLNARLAPGETVAIISAPNGYALDGRVLFDCDAPCARWVWVVASRLRAEPALARQFRQWHAPWVLYLRSHAAANAAGETWDPPTLRAWGAFWNRRAALAARFGDCRVYRLGPAGEAAVQPDLPGAQDWATVTLLERFPAPAARAAEQRRLAAAGLDSARMRAVCGAWATNQGDAAAGVADLERAVAIDPEDGGHWYWLTAARLRAGRRAAATAALARAIALDPRAPLRAALEPALR